MRENLKSKAIIEGAILTSIVFILMMIAAMPSFYIIGVLIVPIPVTIIYIKYKWRISILSVIISFILTSLFLGPINGIIAAISAAFVGIPLGMAIRAKKNWTAMFVYVFIGNIISLIFTMFLTIYLVIGTTFMGFMESTVNGYKQSIKLAMQMSPQAHEIFNQMLANTTVKNFILYLPLGLIVTSFIGAIIIISIARKILVRLKFEVSPIKSFTRWYIDPKIIAVLVAILLIGMELKKNGVLYGTEIFKVSMEILMLLFILQTLSLIAYLMIEKFKMSKVIVVILFVFLFASGYLTMIYPIGLVDVIFDYRSADKNSLGNFIRSKLNTKK